MSRQGKTIGVIFVVGLVAGFGVSAIAQSQREPTTLQGKLAKAAHLSEPQASRFWEALGPVLVDELSQGKVVNVPGLGDFRLVRQPSYRDFNRTRPVTVPASNTIEFRPNESAATAANAAGSLPAEVNDSTMRYNVLPGQTPGLKSPGIKTPSLRTGSN
jgi:nucleoid DNA-binding protein